MINFFFFFFCSVNANTWRRSVYCKYINILDDFIFNVQCTTSQQHNNKNQFKHFNHVFWSDLLKLNLPYFWVAFFFYSNQHFSLQFVCFFHSSDVWEMLSDCDVVSKKMSNANKWRNGERKRWRKEMECIMYVYCIYRTNVKSPLSFVWVCVGLLRVGMLNECHLLLFIFGTDAACMRRNQNHEETKMGEKKSSLRTEMGIIIIIYVLATNLFDWWNYLSYFVQFYIG